MAQDDPSAVLLLQDTPEEKGEEDAGRVDVSEAEEVKIWRDRIAKFLDWRDKEINEDQNQRFVHYYMSNFWRGKSDTPRGGVPLVFTYADVKISALDGADSEFEAKPRDIRYEGQVNAAQAVFNYERRELKWRREWRKALIMAVLTDYGGWIKIGWDSEFGEDDAQEGAGGGQREVKGRRIEHDFNIRHDHPWCKQFSGKDVAFDTTTGTELSDVAWVAVRYRRSLQDLKDDPLNRKAAIEDITRRGTSRGKNEDETEELWEIWDGRRKRLLHFCGKVRDKFVRDPKPWPIDVEGYPIKHLKFFDAFTRDGELRPVFGMAAVRPWFSLNEQRNRFRTNALIASDRLLPKYTGERNTFDGNGKQVFESQIIASFVTTKPGKKIEPLATPNVKADDRLNDQLVNEDFRFASGVAEQQAGVGQEGGDTTATEIIDRKQNYQTRTNDMRTTWEEFLSDVARALLLLIRKYYPPSREVPIYDAGANAIVDTTQFSDEWRNAEYDIVRMKPGSTTPKSKEASQQAMVQIATMLTQLAPGLATTQQVLAQEEGGTFSAVQCMKAILRRFSDELTPSEMALIFPEMDQTSPDEENLVLLSGGVVYVMPEDNDKLHLRSHVRLAMLYDAGHLGEPDEAISAGIHAHIEEHQAAELAENPELLAQAIGAPTEAQGGIPGEEGVPNPVTAGTLGGRANAMQGQMLNRNGGGTNGTGQMENAMNATVGVG